MFLLDLICALIWDASPKNPVSSSPPSRSAALSGVSDGSIPPPKSDHPGVASRVVSFPNRNHSLFLCMAIGRMLEPTILLVASIKIEQIFLGIWVLLI